MKPIAFHYILRETLISVVTNTALSCVFFCIQFRSFILVSWTGHEGLVRDSLPQTFAISLMSVLVPTLITRSRGVRKPFPIVVKPRRMIPSSVIVRAVGVAVLAALCGFGATYVVVGHNPSAVSFRYALAFKCAYGALVALIVTPISLCMALHDVALKTETLLPVEVHHR